MNRREAIRGMFATVGVLATPTILDKVVAATAQVSEQELLDTINKMLMNVYAELWQDFILYSNCLAEHTTEFPFVRRIPPAEWPKDMRPFIEGAAQ